MKYPKELKEIALALDEVMKKYGNRNIKKLIRKDGVIGIGFDGIDEVIYHDNNEAMKTFFDYFISDKYH